MSFFFNTIDIEKKRDSNVTSGVWITTLHHLNYKHVSKGRNKNEKRVVVINYCRIITW